MITGRFGGTSRRPFIEARLFLPDLNLSGHVSFLMDTGADSTMLMPTDSKLLAVPFDKLTGDHECGGIGGTIHTFVERAIVVFNDPNVALYAYDIEIAIMAEDPAMLAVPSLLGRDIIDQWKITYDPLGVGLQASVYTCDREYPLK